MAKKKELKILFSVAHFLQESDYSQSFERLIREAKLEGQIWKVSSSPSLTNVYTEFLPVTAEKVPLTHWVAQYLNHIGFPDSSSQLLSEASLQNEMGTFSTDAFNEFSDFLTHELKKKTEQTFSKKRTRLTEITKPNKRKTSILVDEENEDDYSVQQMAGDESSSFKETVAQLNASMPLDATSDGMKMAGDNEGNEDDEMMVNFKKTTEFLKRAQEHLLSMDGTAADIMPNAKLADLLSSWNCTDALFTWRTKEPRLKCKSYRQRFDDCWAVAISRCQNYAVRLSDFSKPLLTPEKVRDGVSRNFQDDDRGLKHLGHAHSFLVDKYVDEMIFYRRPEKDYEDFESLIERLLIKGPVVVSFDILPSYQSYKGNGVFTPTALECQLRDYENFPGHVVLLTGCGVKIRNGVIKEYWEFQNSMGKTWGEMGFGFLARRKGQIRQVIEMKVTKNST